MTVAADTARTDWTAPVDPDTTSGTRADEQPAAGDLTPDARDLAELEPDELDRLRHFQNVATNGDPDALQPIADLAAIGQRRRLARLTAERRRLRSTPQPDAEPQAEPSTATAADIKPGKVTVLSVIEHGKTVRDSLRDGIQRYAMLDGAAGQLLRAMVFPGETSVFYDADQAISNGATITAAREWLARLIEERQLATVVVGDDVVRYSLRAIVERDQDNPAAVAKIAGKLAELAKSSGAAVVVLEPTQPHGYGGASSGAYLTSPRTALVSPPTVEPNEETAPPRFGGDVAAADGLTTTGVV